MKQIAVALVLFLLLASVSYALSFPRPVGYVNDFAKILNQNDNQQLDSRLSSIDKNTTVQIAIATVTDLQNDTIEDFSQALFKDWGIGQKGQDNGLLILVVPSTHQYRFEVGYGLEGDLNDAKVGQIGRDCFQTYFKNNSYAQGFNCAIDEITPNIADYANQTSTNPIIPGIPNLPLWTWIVIIVVVVVLIIVTKGGILFFLFDAVGGAFGFGGGRSGGGGASGEY